MAELTKEGYLSHLLHTRTSLQNNIKHLEESGNIHYFGDIAAKLRILYCDKSGTKSFFKEIEVQFNLKIEVLVSMSMTEKVRQGILPPSLLENMVVSQTNSVACWLGGGHGYKYKLPIIDAINKNDEIIIDSNSYSYKKIIEIIADKMGGAHIDKSIKDSDLLPFSADLLLGGLSVSYRAIYDTTKTTIELINLIERYIDTPFENNHISSTNS